MYKESAGQWSYVFMKINHFEAINPQTLVFQLFRTGIWYPGNHLLASQIPNYL